MIVTIAAGTQAAQCDKDGNFYNNIRPNVYSVARESEVVKTGYTPAQGYARGYTWYVVKYFSCGYSFVTNHDLVQE